MTIRTIKVDQLARVEGEGALLVTLRDGRVDRAELRIFEPPRYFEAFLRGRDAAEAPDITARICGICPVAYQMSAVHAIERIADTVIPEPIRRLRRLLYCGEWIESHVLHMTMLHAPDFLGYPDAVTMARDHGEAVRRGLALKKAGNAIVALLGGREIHPINVRLGGFYRLPARDAMLELLEQLRRARDDAQALLWWVAGFDFPELDRDYTFVGLRHAREYPFNEGRLVSSRGLDLGSDDYEGRFVEEHMEHANALHVLLDGQPFLCGPLARFNLNHDRLPAVLRQTAADVGLAPGCRNPFRSILARGIEVLYAVDEAMAVIRDFDDGWPAAVPVRPGAGRGTAITEAPRGILYHRYDLKEDGTIAEAKIVAPTGQNQKSIEGDLRGIVERNLALPDAELRHLCEQGIRNHDPCISCATHFLKVTIDGDRR